jgi:hypothetical protein
MTIENAIYIFLHQFNAEQNMAKLRVFQRSIMNIENHIFTFTSSVLKRIKYGKNNKICK